MEHTLPATEMQWQSNQAPLVKALPPQPSKVGDDQVATSKRLQNELELTNLMNSLGSPIQLILQALCDSSLATFYPLEITYVVSRHNLEYKPMVRMSMLWCAGRESWPLSSGEDRGQKPSLKWLSCPAPYSANMRTTVLKYH